MKLIPHCRRVKIRIESNGCSCGTLAALKENFNIEDIIPLVKDGRLQRWLEDLNDDTRALASSLSHISYCGSPTEIGKKVLICFFPDDFNEKANVIDSILYLQNKTKDHKRLLHLIEFFKTEFTKKKLLDNWDYLMTYYGDDFEKIVSLFDEEDKEIRAKWGPFAVKQQNQDIFTWRERLLQSPESKEYPTTAEDLGYYFFGNNLQKITEPALQSFYDDVRYLSTVMGSARWTSLVADDYQLMSKRFHHTEHASDPFELERNFINSLIEWHHEGGSYPQNNLAYKKAAELSNKQTKPTNIRGRIDFVLNDQTPFESMTLWRQILYVTVNIFNKNLYPDWK